MTQVLVTAWIGVTVGWIGFGWVLDEAPADGRLASSLVEVSRNA